MDSWGYVYGDILYIYVAFLMAQMVKNLPAVQETQVQSLRREDPSEQQMATHSIILAWRIPRTQEPGSLQYLGSLRIRDDRATNTFTFFYTHIYSFIHICEYMYIYCIYMYMYIIYICI